MGFRWFCCHGITVIPDNRLHAHPLQYQETFLKNLLTSVRRILKSWRIDTDPMPAHLPRSFSIFVNSSAFPLPVAIPLTMDPLNAFKS
jgi:hypothetical protein